MEDQTNDLKGI